MDTTLLKSFATSARTELIREVGARITAVLAPGSPERVEQPSAVAALERTIAGAGGGDAGKAQAADKVAYTWFNRIIALRFMDANGYTGIGVVSPAADQVGQPEVLAAAKRGQVDVEVVKGTNPATITGLLNGTRQPRSGVDPQAEAYALLLADYCRFWNRSMPFMFEREGDYTELLIPANLLAEDSVLSRAIEVLSKSVCQDVEIIGWLYQYYISERKDEVFAGFKSSKKAGADEIPAATQLFTPHWIVRYLIENSLGRLWMLNHPASRIVDQMDYYISPVDEETDFLKITKPEELTVIDPACGSGHMLTYAFDLLYAIYEEEGYTPSSIPGLILTHNLYGTEIDPRAAALAGFALTMKARGKQRTFFSRQVEPSICVIEPVSFEQDELGTLLVAGEPRDEQIDFWNAFAQADLFGALLRPNGTLLGALAGAADHIPDDVFAGELRDRVARVLRQARYLSATYDIVVANPPYMGAANMGPQLSEWIRSAYPREKQDLYACFVARALEFIGARGRVAMIVGDTWMTAKTSEKFRQEILEGHGFDSFLHLDDVSNHPDIFGANAAFVLSSSPERTSGQTTFVALKPLSSEEKRQQLLEAVGDRGVDWVHEVSVEQLKAVPGMPLAYWLTDAMRSVFRHSKRLDYFGSPKQGIKTGDNEQFLRFWWEVSDQDLLRGAVSREAAEESGRRWFPCQKGGEYRRWYGNDSYAVNWQFDGAEIRDFRDTRGKLRSRPQNLEWMFRPGVTWGTISSGASSFRLSPVGTMSESKGAVCYVSDPRRAAFLLGFLNSSVASVLLAALSPTIDYGEGSVAKLPIDERLLDGPTADLAERAVEISRADWDAQETSLGFEVNDLIKCYAEQPDPLASLFERWEAEARATTMNLADIEEGINRAVAEQTGLLNEVALRPERATISLLKNSAFQFGRTRSEAQHRTMSKQRLVKDLVSYGVGCMFGRYSLEVPGLVLGDQAASLDEYFVKVPDPKFAPDADNVIPIIDGDWFGDDIVERFRLFLRTAFGVQHFETNLRFVTESLGVANLRDYFVMTAARGSTSTFYDDHIKRYKKRPIYWLFSSPTGSFNALIYMHRYTPSTTSIVLAYLREYVTKLESALQQAGRAGDARESDRIRTVLVELNEYEHETLFPKASEKVVIDLDDGVKTNYPKFGAALEKIAGLEAASD
jgi:hypothetical protein